MRHSMLLDRQLLPVATLDSMLALSYELKHNDLSTAEMRLASSDPCSALCTAYAVVHLWDGERDLGLYRVSGSPDADMWDGGSITYSLEHMLATLLDDVIYGTLSLSERPFADAIRDLLAMQSEERWVLGDCDFDTPITQDVGNETLLSAVKTICGLLQEEYTWHCDTGTMPFVLHIRKADADDGCGIHYGRNMTAITRQMDASTVVTRLYLLGGAGKSGRQVDVTTLTEDGVPWIDADTIDQWGIHAAIYQNGDITDPEQLLEKGRSILEARKNPRYTYQASAIDLYQQTGYAWDRYEPGKLVMVTDDDHGVRFSARIVTVSKQDATGDPGSVTVTIATEQLDELDAINAMASILRSVQGGGIGTAAALFQVKNEEAGLETLIEQNAQEILLRATWEAHNALGERMLQAESSLSIQADGIAALSGRTSSLEGTVTEVSAQVRVNNDSIGALVTRTEAIEGRVTSAETEIQALPGTLLLYVKQDELNSSISLSGDGVTIEGGTITLTGYVKASELEAISARIGTLETDAITTSTLSGALASLDAVNLSGSMSANGVQAQYGDFTNATIGNAACKKSTLTIGDKSCTFFAPSDATFNLSDMPGYDAAVAAARTEGAASVSLSTGAWTNGECTVKASNGSSVNVSLPSFYASGGSSFTSAHKTTVYFYTDSVQGYLASLVVDASSVYDAGYQAGCAEAGDDRYDAGYDAGYEAGAASVGLLGGDPSTSNITWTTTIRQIGKVTGVVTVNLSNGNTYERTVTNITAPSVYHVDVNTLTDKCTVHYRNVTTGYTATDEFDW